jgi:hypothetical protein
MNSGHCDQLRAYYQALQWSANELLEMGLALIPSIEKTIYRDDYTGCNKFIEWRDSHCPEWEDPEHFGLEGMDITGYWNSDKSIYRGFFPVRVLEDGSTQITTKYLGMSTDQLLNQIKLAEEHQLRLGLSAKPNFLSVDQCVPNSIFFGDVNLLNTLNEQHGVIRIEKSGSSCWSYGYVDYESDDVKKYFCGTTSKRFKLVGDDLTVGTICRGLIQPCYPSTVFGTPVELVQKRMDKKLLFLPSSKAVKINLDFDDNEYEKEDVEFFDDDDDYEWQHWSCDPDEDERLFNEAVSKLEQLSKINKSIVRHGKQSSEDMAANAVEPCAHRSQESLDQSNQEWLDRLFPVDLAEALRCLKKNLPYDELTVAIAYLTGIASLLKLGTQINGNPLTKYVVPLNLYVAFHAVSGAKKTVLKKLFIDEPAGPIMREIAEQNTREFNHWKERCKGLKKADKPDPPLPFVIRTQDYTAEALVAALERADQRSCSFGVFRDELNGLFKDFNRYSKGQGADEEQLLELFDGHPYSSARITAPRSYQRCSVTICGNIQPKVFADLIKDGDPTGKWARFSFVPFPPLAVQLPTVCSMEDRREVEHATAVLQSYAKLAFQLPPEVYELDSDALKIFSEYEYEKQMSVHAETGDAQSALHEKSAAKTLRYTGLIHLINLLKSIGESGSHRVSVNTLRMGIAIVDHLDNWALSQHVKKNMNSESGITSLMRRLHDLAFDIGGLVTWTQIRNRLSSKEKSGLTRVTAEADFMKLEILGYGKTEVGPNGGLSYRALKSLPAR